MIPPFTDVGLLPASPDGAPYGCARGEMEQRFVTGFGDGGWRRQWFDGWDLLRVSIEADVPSARWWVWGDFVTDRSEPIYGERGTLDVALFVDHRDLRAGTSTEIDAARFARLNAARATAPQHHQVDVHEIVYEFPADHPSALVSLEMTAKLRARATRGMIADSRELVAAGFIEVLP